MNSYYNSNRLVSTTGDVSQQLVLDTKLSTPIRSLVASLRHSRTQQATTCVAHLMWDSARDVSKQLTITNTAMLNRHSLVLESPLLEKVRVTTCFAGCCTR